MLVEGKAELYPRLNPTMERNTIVAYAVAVGTGGLLTTADGCHGNTITESVEPILRCQREIKQYEAAALDVKNLDGPVRILTCLLMEMDFISFSRFAHLSLYLAEFNRSLYA
jgi:hypothetical protein